MSSNLTTFINDIIESTINQTNIFGPVPRSRIITSHPPFQVTPVQIINNYPSEFYTISETISPVRETADSSIPKKYGYSYTFKKPEGNVLPIIENFSKIRRIKLIKSMTGTNNIEVLLRQKMWTLPMNADGTKLLIKLFLGFPTWNGWSLTSKIPVSMEGIYSLGMSELKDLCLRFRPKILINSYITKIGIFKYIVIRMMTDGLIIKSETELICPKLFESLKYRKKEILTMIPTFHGMTQLSRLQLSFRYILFQQNSESKRISPDDLIEMGREKWLELAIEEKITNNGESFLFSSLVQSLIKNKRLASKYVFIGENSFWQFYQKYYHYLPELGVIYKSTSKSEAKIALHLFMHGIFSIDLEPDHLVLLKSIKSLDLIPARVGPYVIPEWEEISIPRRIITPESIIELGNLKVKDLISYIRETDLLFFDAANPAPLLEIPDKSLISGGPSSHLENWKHPKCSTPYHYIKPVHINDILSSRGLRIPSTTEGKRCALNGLDKGCRKWTRNVIEHISVSTDNLKSRDVSLAGCLDSLDPAELYYLSGHFKINSLNGAYHYELIRISIRLIVGGLNPPNITRKPTNFSINLNMNNKLGNLNSESEILTATIESRQIRKIARLPKETMIWRTIQEANQEINDLTQHPIIIDPNLYCDLRLLSWYSLIMLVEILYPSNLKAIIGSERDHLFLLSRGCLLSPPSENIINRYRSLATLSDLSRDLLFRYHSLLPDRLRLIKLTLRTPTIVDKYVIEHNFPKLAEVLGMIIPTGVNEKDYIMDNIQSYRLIFDRLPSSARLINHTDPKTLSLGNISLLTDEEIISSAGIRPLFADRNELITKVRKLWFEDGFFESIDRTSINEETFVLTKVSDPDVLMIGYGRLDSYRCYEMGELHLSFRLGEDEMVHFRKPENKDHFDLDKIVDLDLLIQDLYSRLVGNPDILIELHTRIEKGITDYRQMNTEMKKIYHQIRLLNSSTKDILKVWLQTLFDAGMYMRQWKGPGTPYPHTRREARQGEEATRLKPERSDNISPLGRKIGLLQEMIKTAPSSLIKIIEKLKAARYDLGLSRYESQDILLIPLFLEVARGNKCIREASSIFTLSAGYYFQVLFNHKIKDFHPELIAKVN